MQPTQGRLCWQWLQLWMLISIFQDLRAAPKPQDVMESVGAGIMTAASSALDMMQKGVALRKDLGFDLPFGGANSKTELGFGEAIVGRPNDEEDSDEDRRRRRKRNTAGDRIDILPHTEHPHLHRGKRSPCYTGTGTGAGGQQPTPIEDAEEIARRRRRKAAARKRSQKSTTTARKSKNTKRSTNAKKFHSRLRRQAEMAEEAGTLGQKISEHAKQAAKKLRSFWAQMVNTAKEVAQNVKASFGGNATGNGPPNGGSAN